VASPGGLVRKFSELLGIAEPTIVLHDRSLVVAGLRSKSGRGNSAAQMTPRDAAHLLVAVLGSSHVKDSAEAVRRYRETRFHKSASRGYDDSTIAALRNLPPDHSFVDAIEALVAAAADGSLQAAMYDSMVEFEGKKIGDPPIIEITVQTPGLLGDISISGGGHGRYVLPDPFDQYQTLHPPTSRRYSSGARRPRSPLPVRCGMRAKTSIHWSVAPRTSACTSGAGHAPARSSLRISSLKPRSTTGRALRSR
jgi:hypothetical protein